VRVLEVKTLFCLLEFAKYKRRGPEQAAPLIGWDDRIA
jgi:hypothetical protein